MADATQSALAVPDWAEDSAPASSSAVPDWAQDEPAAAAAPRSALVVPDWAQGPTTTTTAPAPEAPPAAQPSAPQATSARMAQAVKDAGASPSELPTVVIQPGPARTWMDVHEGRDETPSQPAPPAPVVASKTPTWADVAGAVPTEIGAKIETVGAGYQEHGGASEYADARKKFWQSMILPRAVRESRDLGIALIDHPDVQDEAKRLGVRVDVFARDWPKYANMSDDDLAKFQAEQRARIETGQQQELKGAKRRQTVEQVRQGYEPQGLGTFSPKGLAFNVVTMAPELLAGTAASMVGGAPLAVGTLFADAAPQTYAAARNAGASDQTAANYAVLSGVAQSVPEVPVFKVIGDTGAGRAILETAVGRTLAKTTAGKIAGTAVTQGVTQATIQALQTGIDAGIIDQHTSLSTALERIGQAGIIGAVTGAPLGAMHAAMHPEPKEGRAPTPAPAERGVEDEAASSAPELPAMTAEGLLGHAQLRLGELDRAASGTPAMRGGQGGRFAIPEQPPRMLSTAERAEREFLRANQNDPQALARAYGVRVAEPPSNEGAKVEVTPQAPQSLQERLSSDQALRQGLEAMKAETGWYQKGGYQIRDPESGEVTGRTKWIPNADWWRDRPRGMTEEEVHSAVDKALAGEDLTDKQQRFVQFMADVHDERQARAATRDELAEAEPGVTEQPPATQHLSVLIQRAGEIDHEATTGIIDTWNDDKPATLARVQAGLERIIGRGLEDQRTGAEQPSQARGVPSEEGGAGATAFVADLERARSETDTAPSDAAKAAGNYAKGKLSFAPGLTVALENPKGSTRSGTEPDGTRWSRTLSHDYGYVLGTEAKDGDHVDAFLTGKPDTGKVFVVNQVDPETGRFDEPKLILGADTEDEARRTYLANYPRGWKGLGSVAEMSTGDARQWLESGVRDRPARSTVRPERRVNPVERSRVAEMSPEELRASLLTHELTGIPNRRAYRESEKLPTQVSVDANSLKWVNDTGSHAAGDEVLRRIAEALHDETPHAYHFGGDEFAVQAHTPEEAEQVIARAKERLSKSRLTLEDRNGRKIELNGIGIAHGTGRTLEEADRALEGEKERQQAAGIRARRGEPPPEATRGVAEERVPAREHRAAAPRSEGTQGEVAPAGAAAAPRFSRRAAKPWTIHPEDSEPVIAAKLLANQEGAFRYPLARSKDFADVVHDIAPDFEVERAGTSFRPKFEIYRTELVGRRRLRSGEPARVTVEPDGTVVLDISRFDPGEGGSAVYQAVGDFAHNNGLRFVGDPEGLSPIARIRRTVHMLSSALRWGTTRHLGGHELLERPDIRGVEPLGWRPGDDAHNVRALVRSVVSTYGNLVPDVKRIRYNWEARRFEDERGRPVTDQRFADLARESRRRPLDVAGRRGGLEFETPAGRQTLKTVALLQSGLPRLHGEGLARLSEQLSLHHPLADLGLEKVFYRRGASGGLPASHVAHIVREAVRHGNFEGGRGFPHVEVHEDTSTLPPHIQDAIARDEAHETTGAVYDPGTDTVHLIAANNGSEQEVRENLWHEAVGHHGLRLIMDPHRYAEVMDGIARDMPARVQAAARRNGLDVNDLRQRRVAAEEVVAYAAGRILTGQPIEKSLLPVWQRALNAIRAFFARIRGKPFYDEREIASLVAESAKAVKLGNYRTRLNVMDEARRAARAATWYSPLERAVASSKQGKASPEQWLATLGRSAGVKTEEREWSGVDDWLKEQKGPVTREQLLDYLRANRLELEETLKGAAPGEQQSETERERNRLAEGLRSRGYEVSFDSHGGLESIGEPVDGAPTGMEPHFVHEVGDLEGLPQDVQADAQRLAELSDEVAAERFDENGLEYANGSGGTRFDQYTLPGGENYRELLIRLPQRPGEKPFTGSHWSEPNVLAHVRFNDRTDADGKKTLFIEEVQSDWHQAGRKRGYGAEELDTSGWTAEEDPHGIERFIVRDAQGSVIGRSDQPTASQAIRHVADRRENLAKGVPQAPFKTSWPSLVMKRMVRFAAEHGYDRIAWAPGDVHTERYNLSRHIGEVRLEDSSAPGSEFQRGRLVAKDPSGNEVYDDFVNSPQDLEDLLGKDVAARLVAQEPVRWPEPDQGKTELRIRTLFGLDLKSGGEGMRGFYDQILPRETQKLVKRWGGKVEDGEVSTAHVPPQFTDADREELARLRSQDLADLPASAARRLEELKDLQDRVSRAAATGQTDRQTAPAHGFDITQEMRQAALGEGMPLFSRREAAREGGIDGGRPAVRSGESLDFGEPPEEGTGAYERLRRAVDYLVRDNPIVRDIRKIVAPVGLSRESMETARLATKAFGQLAADTHQVREHLEQFARVVERLPIEDQLEMIDAIENGRQQPHPELQPVADAMRKTLDHWRDEVQRLGNGYLENFIENYFPHYWADEAKAKRLMASVMGRRPLRGPASFLKRRTIATIKEGMDAGLVPLTTNPLTMTLLKTREMQRFVAGVNLMRTLKAHGLAEFQRAGRPMPEGWASINDASAKVRQWSEVEQGFIERGQYVMPEDAARVINNHVSASALGKFAPAQVFRIGANALSALQLGFSGFHLGFTTLDAVISKNALAFERLLHGEPVKAAAAFGEALTGPGAAALNIRRGQQLLEAYSNPAKATPQLQKIVKALIAAGGRASMDRYYLPSGGESPFRGAGIHSLASDLRDALTGPDKAEATARAIGAWSREYPVKLWRTLQEIGRTYPAFAVPLEIAGRITRASTAWIMEHVVPLQKLGVFSDLAHDYLRRNPTAGPDELARAMQSAWASVDNRLGEMVYDNLFWNRTWKDAMHLAVRAVGWNLGTIREIAGAPVAAISALDKLVRTGKVTADDLGHKIPYVLAMTLTTAMVGASLQYLLTGQGPQDLKDYFFPRTGGVDHYGNPERLSLPSYVKDLYEYSQRPGKTIANKLNPIWSTTADIYENEDYFGRPISDPDANAVEQAWQRAQFVGREAMPFSLQGARQIAGSEGTGFGAEAKRALPYIGLSPAPGYITSPDQIAHRERYEQEQAYTRETYYELRQALQNHDQAAVGEYRDRWIAAKQREAATRVEIMKDRARAAAGRRQISQNLRSDGKPATAALVDSLPLTLDSDARAALARFVDAAVPAAHAGDAPLVASVGSDPRYETALSPQQESGYRAWLAQMEKQVGHDLSSDDYDMQGAYLAGLKPGPNAHFDDEFKKPNHFTFSTDSKYSGHPYVGGTWAHQGGRWVFRASPDNLRFHTAQQLTDYFKRVERDSVLYLPGQRAPAYEPRAGGAQAARAAG